MYNMLMLVSHTHTHTHTHTLSLCRGQGFDPWLRKSLHAMWCGVSKNKNHYTSVYAILPLDPPKAQSRWRGGNSAPSPPNVCSPGKVCMGGVSASWLLWVPEK